MGFSIAISQFEFTVGCSEKKKRVAIIHPANPCIVIKTASYPQNILFHFISNAHIIMVNASIVPKTPMGETGKPLSLSVP